METRRRVDCGLLAPAGEPPGGVGAIATSSALMTPAERRGRWRPLHHDVSRGLEVGAGSSVGAALRFGVAVGLVLKASVAERVTTRDVNADFILNSGRRRFSPAAPSVATSTSTGRLRSSRGFCSRSFDRANPVRCRRHMRARSSSCCLSRLTTYPPMFVSYFRTDHGRG